MSRPENHYNLEHLLNIESVLNALANLLFISRGESFENTEGLGENLYILADEVREVYEAECAPECRCVKNPDVDLG